MGYAYRDKYGILHVVNSESTAKEYAKSKVVEFNGEYSSGYPEYNGKAIFDYGDGRVFYDGNAKSGIALADLEKSDPELAKNIIEVLEKIGL